MPSNASTAALTPAAQQMLEEAVQDFRAQVLAAAEVSALQATGETREIAVRDIAAGLSSAHLQDSARRFTQVDRILYAYSAMGILLAAASFGYALLRYATIAAEPALRLSILVGLSGSLLAVVSGLYLRFRKLRLVDARTSAVDPSGQVSAEFLFIARWRDLEVDLRRIAAAELGESESAVPFSVLLDVAVSSARLSKEEAGLLRQLLGLRNRILHHKGGAISGVELREAMRSTEKLRSRLRRQADHEHS